MKAGIGSGIGVAILDRVCQAWWWLGSSVFRYVCRRSHTRAEGKPDGSLRRKAPLAEWPLQKRSASVRRSRKLQRRNRSAHAPMTVAEDSCGRDRMSKLSFKVDVEFLINDTILRFR